MREPATRTAVSIQDLTVAYGDHVALRVPNLSLPAQRITAVIGPNGSGKSTLLDTITGLATPATGTVTVFGRQPADARPDVAYVLQTTTTNEVVPMTVREVVTMGRYAARGTFRPLLVADRRAVTLAMERLSIEPLGRRHLTELSGGQRQRVYVAQGLAQEADLLLLDEPGTGLDLPTKERMAEIVVEERDAGRTIIYTTHDVGEAAEADFVVLLAREVVAAGKAEAVLTTRNLAAAYGAPIRLDGTGTIVLADARHPHHRS
ncbi:MAG: metal ABC transporter ATP-binding protein [Actinomycetota bacterium]|nr:metal ABC transporter ATP-binding protein [Actinomycetota bacterium]